jgi:hypothetical protein
MQRGQTLESIKDIDQEELVEACSPTAEPPRFSRAADLSSARDRNGGRGGDS